MIISFGGISLQNKEKVASVYYGNLCVVRPNLNIRQNEYLQGVCGGNNNNNYRYAQPFESLHTHNLKRLFGPI